MNKRIIALAVAAALSGCTTAAMKPIKDGVTNVDNDAAVATEKLRKGEPISLPVYEKKSHIKVVKEMWLPVKKDESLYTEKQNSALNRIVAVNRKFISLADATAYITSLTGVPTSTSVSATAAGTLMPVTTPTGMQSNLPPVPAGAINSAMNPAMTNAFSVNAQQTAVAYNGTLSGFLDLIAARYSASWEMERDSVRFFKTKSKTFRIAALPGNTSLKSTIGSQSSGSSEGTTSSSGVATQEAGTEFSGLSVWQGIEDSVKTMLSPDGRLTVTPATGTITVDDTPMVLERVSKFIDNQNDALSRQVVINVKVLSVDLTDSDEYGINWNAVYTNVNRSLGFSLSNAITPSAGATNMTLKVLSGSMWDGTTAMVDALSKQGRVSQVTSASMVTINNQPAPIQVGKQTSYLASSQTTLGVNGSGNTTTLQPGKISTGFSMNMIPHILDSNKLMLQYSGDISSLIRIGSVSSGGSSIQTPEVDTRNFLQRVIMNSGETLVVTGFEQFNLSGDTQGVGDAENVAVGGGVRTKRDKSVLVVLIQPVLSGNQ
jgi:type IVB pilus formation R64 PilN family outer membrane protein